MEYRFVYDNASRAIAGGVFVWSLGELRRVIIFSFSCQVGADGGCVVEGLDMRPEMTGFLTGEAADGGPGQKERGGIHGEALDAHPQKQGQR